MKNLKLQLLFIVTLGVLGGSYGLISFVADNTNEFKTIQGEHFFRSKCREFGKGELKDIVILMTSKCKSGTYPFSTQAIYFEACDDTKTRVQFSFQCREE